MTQGALTLDDDRSGQPDPGLRFLEGMEEEASRDFLQALREE